jgi:hypothetical protein
MKSVTDVAARALSLVAAIVITTVIIFVHAAEPTSLGVRAVVATGAIHVAAAERTATPSGTRSAPAASTSR